MRRSNTVHSAKRRHIHLIVRILLTVTIWWTALAVTASASSSSSIIIDFDHYDDVSLAESQSSSSASDIQSSTVPPEEIKDPTLSKEEIDVREFNGTFLDTVLYILGGISGFMMILQITVFVATKIYPATGRIFEKLKKIGIDGYADGYVFPTIKILILGLFAYVCISGAFKRVIIYIVSWFVTLT